MICAIGAYRLKHLQAFQNVVQCSCTSQDPRSNLKAGRYERGRSASAAIRKELTVSEHVYKLVELVGSSKTSIEDAVQNAIGKAGESLRNLRWFQVTETRGYIED